MVGWIVFLVHRSANPFANPCNPQGSGQAGCFTFTYSWKGATLATPPGMTLVLPYFTSSLCMQHRYTGQNAQHRSIHPHTHCAHDRHTHVPT